MRRHPSGLSGFDGRQRFADLADHARRASDGTAPLGRECQPGEKDADSAQPQHDREHEPQTQLKVGLR